MANRFWVGGTNTWNATSTGKWATTSGGASGAATPTAADDVFFDASSTGVVTLATGIACRSLNCTGFTGTISHPASTAVFIGDATAGASNIALKFVAGITYTLGSTTTSTISFSSTSATQQTVDFGGKTIGLITFGTGSGSPSYLLTSSIVQSAASTLGLTRGTLDTNNLNHTWGLFSSSNSNARTLNLGSSTITMTGASWDMSTSTNLTFNAGTSTLGWTSSTAVTPTINAPSMTFYDILITKSSGGSVINGTGTSTFHNYTMDNTVVGGGNRAININITGGIVINGIFKHYGASAANAGFIFSGTTGSSRTIALGTTGTVDFQNVDFRDIAITGTAAPVSGTNLSDGGGNSGITFPASKTMYYIGGTANVNSSAAWSLTSGGASAGSIPLLHDTAIFDANSFSTTGMVATMGSMRMPGFDASAATNSPTFRFTNPNGAGNGIYGGMIFPSGGSTIDTVGAPGSASTIGLGGRSSHAITTNGAAMGTGFGLTISAPGATYTLGSDMNMNDATRTLNLTIGTLDANGYNVTCGLFSSSNANTRTLTMGSGTWTLTGTGNVWNTGTTTGLTLNAGTSTVSITDTSVTAKTVSLGTGANFYNLAITGGGTGAVTLSNPAAPTLNNLTIGAPKTVLFNAARTYTINGTFTAIGTSGNLITINSTTPGSQATLSKASGVVSADYLSLQDSAATGGATWYAGANSTNVSNNTGWIFTAPPSGGTIKIYNGSIWVEKPLTAQGVAKPLYYHNGTTLVKTTS
jgi:hypothetical protein